MDKVERLTNELSDVVSDCIQQMIRLTCMVHLRAECQGCVAARLNRRFNSPEAGAARAKALSEHGIDAYLRSAIVWAKEETEKEMAEPCSLENAKAQMGELLPVVFGEHCQN